MQIGDQMAYIQPYGAENLSECSPGSGERFSKILSSNFLEHLRKIKVFHVGPSDFPLDFPENPHTNGSPALS